MDIDVFFAGNANHILVMGKNLEKHRKISRVTTETVLKFDIYI